MNLFTTLHIYVNQDLSPDHSDFGNINFVDRMIKIKESEKEERINEKFCFHHIIWLQYGQTEKVKVIHKKRKSENQMTYMS